MVREKGAEREEGEEEEEVGMKGEKSKEKQKDRGMGDCSRVGWGVFLKGILLTASNYYRNWVKPLGLIVQLFFFMWKNVRCIRACFIA